ncbi:short-chain dehydrogenase/reductase SDR [Obba rivulosa]|uniref:Short-chain dehydrogenase/reductase SDR n=1 Tax=Obba rivulosa TaxID=1052685 RepID=A0A8E2ATK1_9APHY|nr:short-chain dehydrogenase/reductase SDR [Obba rivulosa]
MIKVAIITGASSGIGRASAIALSKAGWSLVLFARRKEKLTETQNLCQNPNQCLIIQGDVTSEESVKGLFQQTLERYGRLDMLFNDAGMNAPQIPIEDLSLDQFQQIVNINLVGPFLCTREAVRMFKSQSPQGGRIINNGSISAYTPRPHSAPYTSTKHAVLGLTKSTALDGRAFNITCTEIDIGGARTDMAIGHSAGALQPDGRIISEALFEAEHVGNTIAYIADLPLDVTVLTFNIMATGMPFVGRG